MEKIFKNFWTSLFIYFPIKLLSEINHIKRYLVHKYIYSCISDVKSSHVAAR